MYGNRTPDHRYASSGSSAVPMSSGSGGASYNLRHVQRGYPTHVAPPPSASRAQSSSSFYEEDDGGRGGGDDHGYYHHGRQDPPTDRHRSRDHHHQSEPIPSSSSKVPRDSNGGSRRNTREARDHDGGDRGGGARSPGTASTPGRPKNLPFRPRDDGSEQTALSKYASDSKKKKKTKKGIEITDEYDPDAPFWYERPRAGRQDLNAFDGTNSWEVSTLGAGCYLPFLCLASYWCPWCLVYRQRRKLLLGNMAHYECCAGLWGPSCTTPCEKCIEGNERICLCFETVFCLGSAIHANRWMVMQHYDLEEDCCDTCYAWSACGCSLVGCLLGDENAENLADVLYIPAVGCMMAQEENQMRLQGYPLSTNEPMF